MKTFICLLVCFGLVSTGSVIKENHKRFILSFSTCNDALDNCASYPPTVCTDPTYAGWAKDNCQSTCNLCSSGGSSSGGGGGGGTSGCTDKLSDCAAYGPSSCTGQYTQWATENCAQTCNLCARSSSSASMPVPNVAPLPAMSTGCADKMADCSSYGPSACTGQYEQWAKENCAKTCNLCSSGGSVPVLTTAAPMPVPVSSGGCADKLTNCAAYGQSSCTGQYAQWAKDNCAKTCNLCTSSTGGGHMPPVPVPVSGNGGSVPQASTSCTDKRSDCSSYGPSACTGQYAQWAQENCAKTCNLCTSSSGGGGVPSPVGGATQAPGGGGAFSGQSTGCYYNSQLYQQGENWKDACKYKCTCTDGTSGKYECRQLCLDWNLPPTCHMEPPAAGKCCPKPSCPPNILLQYPKDYVEE